MKVGTDSVLLGAWVNVNFPVQKSFYRAFEIGTGTGIISLMMAQRNEWLYIDAIEKDLEVFRQGRKNIQDSPFMSRIYPKPFSLQEFRPDTRYDLVVSNPPYFSGSLKSPDDKRNIARHADYLPLKTLVWYSSEILADSGRIALILPTESSEELDVLIAVNKLYVVRRTDVMTVEGRKPKRFMIELAHNQAQTPDYNTLTLETEDGKKTVEYQELAKDFYLE
jgi:tRNA1Val (adenine37-N6)-methyltransferase